MPKGSMYKQWYADPMQGGYAWPGIQPDQAGKPQGMGAIPGRPGQSPTATPGMPRSAYMDWSTDQWNDYTNKQLSGATDIYQSMLNESGGAGKPQAMSVPAAPQTFQSGMDTWRNGSPADQRRNDEIRFSTGGAGGGGSQGRQVTGRAGNVGDVPQLDLGGITLDLPEYNPPAEDEGVRKAAFEESYQRGKGDLSQSVHNAIISTKSLDNPAARAKMMDTVLSSMGSGLNEIAKAAGQTANQEAARKRAEQLQIYNAQYSAESAEAQAEYNRDLAEAQMNFEAEMSQWQQEQAQPQMTDQGIPEADFVGQDMKREGGQLYEWRGPNAGWVAIRG